MAARFRLRELLEAHEPTLSQSELERVSGVSFATINRLATNATKQVSLETLDRLARELGLEPGDLIERTPEKRRVASQINALQAWPVCRSASRDAPSCPGPSRDCIPSSAWLTTNRIVAPHHPADCGSSRRFRTDGEPPRFGKSALIYVPAVLIWLTLSRAQPSGSVSLASRDSD
jgi:DNA-binding Xre family transcriptional regulator